MRTRLRAVSAALRSVEDELMDEQRDGDDICLHVYRSLGVVSVFDVRGRTKTPRASFSWPVKGDT
jgi:hypothetical protein